MNLNSTPDVKKIYIIHGHDASPNDHWYPWLSRKLQLAGHYSRRIVMANADQPNFEAWQKFLALQMPDLDENTIVIAHSLGCITALHYLNQRFEQLGTRIKAGIFVSGFKNSLSSQPKLTNFLKNAKLDSGVLQTHMPICFSFVSSNDPVVPPPASIQLGSFINAQIIEVRNAGHFLAEDGFLEISELWDVLKPLLTA
ncbi:hypothetical protein B9T33_09075 [Acinetobacter sp. ANC 5054]|uniref:RBBP9/YdeN family alpha/beta hydrolase n=1 Tax=Acinetobacter sp. ANC 5054 TaxID=1977877 RepID=UPI000A3316A0|nr:alpha/beta hydrolase [Acinetobacter sp. ANC 5054]OTG80568.1 hypothetical protein B9T33_09075 [Acinetobacter sp. ANC 5054]